MAQFIISFQKTIVNEGGYVNDPDDPGGETYKGIARKMHPTWLGFHIIDLLKKQPNFPANLDANSDLREEVGIFYLNNFWNKIKGDEISNQEIAESIFDFAVNAGVEPAVVLAQNVVNSKADGVIGPNTIIAINAFDPDHFLKSYTVAKIARYIAIVKKRPTSRKYFYGWVVRAIGIFILGIISLGAFSQAYLKVADKPEYEKYFTYCNDSILVDIVQYGKVTILMQYVPGLDFEMAKMMPGTFTDLAVKKDTFWYAPWHPGMKATKYLIHYNQAMVTRIIKVKVPNRIASIKDFYLNWMTNKIKH